MLIRNALAEDIHDINKILYHCELDSRDLRIADFLVAVPGNRIAGCVRHKQFYPDMAEICSLGVLENFRHKGIGGNLQKRKTEELLKSGIRKIFVVTMDDRLFRRHGFKITNDVPLPVQQKVDWCNRELPVGCPYFAMKLDISGDGY